MYKEELYYICVKTDTGILSIDNIRIAFEAHERYLHYIADFFSQITRIDIEKYPESSKLGSYRHLWTIRYTPDASMTIGLEFNGTNHQEDRLKGYLDFNPNKVGRIEQFWRDYDTLKQWCIFDIKRCDIAYDVPIHRERVRMVKDRRKYRIDSKSLQDFTEYLGQRNKEGFVKVYNKQIESDLDEPLTRIEVTCKFDITSYFCMFPKVYVINDGKQITIDDPKLNDYDKVILTMACDLLGLGGDPFQALMLFQRPDKRKKLVELMPVEPLPLPFVDVVHQLVTKYEEVLKLS